MRKLIAATVLAAGLVFSGGCDKSDAVAVGVGVIDLQKIAKDTGRETVIAGQIENARMQLQSDMRRNEPEMRKRLMDEAAAAKQTMTPEQVNERIAQVRQMVGNQQMERLRQDVITKFRAAIDPAVIKVAQAKGIGVVFVAGSATIMVTDKGADLTDDVVNEIKENKDFFGDANTPEGAAGGGGVPGLPPMPGTPPNGQGAPPPTSTPSLAPGLTPNAAPGAVPAPTSSAAPGSAEPNAPAPQPAAPASTQPSEPMK